MKKLLVIFLFFITACTEMHSKTEWGKPASFSFEPPPGPPIYQQAFKDGCESGFSGYANSFNKMFWTWKQDPELITNNVYYQMWKDAYAYCGVVGMMADEHGFGNWR